MQLVRGLHNLPRERYGRAITIGNFDGVHLGHQQLIEGLVSHAEEFGLKATVVLFEPQPAEYLSPENAPARLSTLREKVVCLSGHRLEEVVVLRFDKHFAQMEAAEFIDRILVEGLNTNFLLIGDDFRFGRQRRGDYTMLEDSAGRCGYELYSVDTIMDGGQRISSTRIRELLSKGDFGGARSLLGRAYRMSGRVGHGRKLGRDIGYPTINIPVRRIRSPLNGIFAVRVFGLHDQEPVAGVASIGSRPTLDDGKCLLEAHLFDWSGDCYGEYLEVEFVSHIRDEAKFTDLDALKMQIGLDAERARQVLGQ